MTLRIFLSSTAQDLAAHRDVVSRAIRTMGGVPDQMEIWGAIPERSVPLCRKRAAEADAIVVMVAHRYGWVPSVAEGGDGERSITWLEVDAAEAAAKRVPVFAFLVDGGFEWGHGCEQDDLADATSDEDALAVWKRLRSLGRLRDHLNQYVRAKFTTPDNLAAQVAASLGKWIYETHGGAHPNRRAGLTAYLEALEQRTSSIDIKGIASAPGRTRSASRTSIESLYTPLRTRAPLAVEETGAASSEAFAHFATRGDRVLLAEVLPQQRLLLIEGQPGAGKSTFLRLAACMLARDRLGMPCPGGPTWRETHLGMPSEAASDGSPGAPLPPVPVLVTLGSLASLIRKKGARTHELHPRRWILDLLAEQCGENGPDSAFWDELFTRGEALLLLDGLDEAADPSVRPVVQDVIRDVAQGKSWSRCPLVVTSRPIDTDALRGELGFETVTVDELALPEIDEFLSRWVAVLYGASSPEEAALPADGRAYLASLRAEITGRARIRRLAANPVMLTCLCVVHWNERQIPEGKARVYAAVIRWLENARRELRQAQGYTEHFAHTAFALLALAMMGPDGKKRTAVELGEAARLIEPVVQRTWPGDDAQARRRRAIDWLRFECTGSGIVEEWSGGQVRFWHLTFQEFLAAQQLAWMGDGESGDDAWWPIASKHLEDPQWRETIDFLPGCLLENGQSRVDLLLERTLADCLDPANRPAGARRGGKTARSKGKRGRNEELPAAARAAGLVGRLLCYVATEGYAAPAGLMKTYQDALDRSMEIFTIEGAAQVPVGDRIAVAEALGRGVDPRFRSVDPKLLPIPGHPSVLLGKYPITVEEYREFVDAGGYGERRCWSAEGWQLRQQRGWAEPGSWEQQLETSNCPVVHVSWYEAEAYCAWRTEMEGRLVRLPSGEEWQAAAIHTEGEYPWGTEEPTPELANFERGKLYRPTPVGVYPSGVAPGGHLDLAGNVWEWCSDDQTSDVSETDLSLWQRAGYVRTARGARGGAFFNPGDVLRSHSGNWLPADFRYVGIGFRVAASPASTAVP